jgi:hypothetical protein
MVILFCSGAALPQNLVVFSMPAGECELRIESNEKWKTLRLRAHHPKYQGCQITKDEMVSALDQTFSNTEPPRLEGTYSSLSIGRLIDYPWLCQYLSATAYRDRAWDSKKGKPAEMDINNYVSQLLFRKELIAPIETLFEKSGYRVAGVTVEKVLVGGFREVPFYRGEMLSGRVPYDAQVWFRLERH